MFYIHKHDFWSYICFSVYFSLLFRQIFLSIFYFVCVYIYLYCVCVCVHLYSLFRRQLYMYIHQTCFLLLFFYENWCSFHPSSLLKTQQSLVPILFNLHRVLQRWVSRSCELIVLENKAETQHELCKLMRVPLIKDVHSEAITVMLIQRQPLIPAISSRA